MKVDILGVKIDNINLTDSLAKIEHWIWNPGKHYIVTPNLEFILAAQKDLEFKKILNNADLAIPDSSSIGLSYWLLKRHPIVRLVLWPLFLIPVKQMMHFEVVPGVDLMEALCKVAVEKGFTTGFLGGGDEVAEKTVECLRKKYPNLNVVFAKNGGEVNSQGDILRDRNSDREVTFKNINSLEGKFSLRSNNINVPPVDILFVAFGHVKQEKWIANNLEKIPVHVAIGVGGAFDYLSGSVPRAPGWMRSLGLEWLFRLIVQPWRIKRQFSLLRYVWLLTTAR